MKNLKRNIREELKHQLSEKVFRKTIKKEIQKLTEDKYPIPLEIQLALEEKLKMAPIIRYVNYIKAVNSIPPSYEIYLHNDRSFLMYYEDFSLMVKIEGREYYLMDLEERSNAIEHINRLLVPNAVQPIEEPEKEEKPADEPAPKGGADDVAMEPEDEPADEEPADEEPTV
tara:strand:- start:679 stop:1191 length:513 start_codon:yes stop_codon:yes gene_type:complete